MSQQIFHRAYAPDFATAVEAKNILLAENPDGNYQIRRRRNNFEIVIRLPAKQVKIEQEINPMKRRRRKRHAKRQGI